MSANSSSVTPLHRRPNRPETPQYASVSPGRRSRQRTTAAENRTEVQTHGEIGARFLRNRPEVAATAAVHKTSKREHLDAAVRVAILRTLMTPSVL